MRQFAEDALLIREAGQRDPDNWRWVKGVRTETPIQVATAPVDDDEALSRVTLPEGTRDYEGRKFWTLVADLSPGDRIRYPADGGDVFLVVAVSRWRGVTTAIALRDDAAD